MPRFGFIGGEYDHPLSNVGAESTRNWVPEYTAPGQSKSRLVLVPRPGLARVGTADVPSNGAGHRWRAGFEQNGQAWIVAGPDLYEVIENTAQPGTVTCVFIASVGDDGRPASIAGNGPAGGQLVVVSASLGYTVDIATRAASPISDPQFPADALMVAYVDGYFIVIPRDSREFGLSASYDGTSWAASDIGEKSKTNDYIQAGVVHPSTGELWLIGTRDTEVWTNDGGAAFPFSPVQTRIAVGNAATFGWTTLGGTIYGLAQSQEGGRVIVRFAGGYAYERVSHHAMESAIQAYDETAIANCQAFAFELNGHRFVVFTFKEANATWVFDEATSLWTRWDFRLAYGSGVGTPDRAFIGLGHLFVFGKHLLGSHDDGAIYHCSTEYADDDGNPIRRVRRSPIIGAEGKRALHYALRLDFQLGVGTGSGQGADPVCLIRWSENAGKTWSAEQTLRLGAGGEFSVSVELRRLGLAGPTGRMYEVVVTDPVITGITDAYVDVGAAA